MKPHNSEVVLVLLILLAVSIKILTSIALKLNFVLVD